MRLARAHAAPQAEATWVVESGWLAYRRGRLSDADRFAVEALRIAKPRDLVLTVFRAEWLRHLVVVKRRPGAPSGAAGCAAATSSDSASTWSSS